MAETETAIIVGVGPGLGASLARCFGRDRMQVALAARRRERIEPIAAEIGPLGGSGMAYECDATDEAQVRALFDSATRDFDVPDLVVFNASGRVQKSVVDMEVAEFEQAWRQACLGGFIVGREAARRMLTKPENSHGTRGTILFTGATASVKGYAKSAGFAVGKFGLRALAQSMARDFSPKGIHVAHVVIDGGIRSERRPGDESNPDALLDPDAIADTYLHLHRQHRSAWAQEIDVRPWVESF